MPMHSYKSNLRGILFSGYNYNIGLLNSIHYEADVAYNMLIWIMTILNGHFKGMPVIS